MKRLRWEAALVGFVALAATLAATERTPLTWDEGDAFVRAERVAAWTRAVVVGPQRLRETLSANEVKPQNDAGFNDSNAQTPAASAPDAATEVAVASDVAAASEVGAATDVETPSNLPRLASLNAETKEAAGEVDETTSREERDRRRFGDVERAALGYFARLDGRRALFSEKALEAGWPHAIYREGHPAGYSIAIAAGRAFSLRFLPFLSEKAAFRFGPIALFAAALAAVFYRVARNWGRNAAVLAVVGIISIPRAFGHAQLAGGDSLLISSWLLAWAFFDAALASKRGAIALGAAVGVSFCAKFSGFTVVFPLAVGAVAALWARRPAKTSAWGKMGGLRGLRNGENAAKTGKKGSGRGGQRRDGVAATAGRLTLALGVAAALFFAANPPLWSRPVAGFETFVSLNLRRDGFDIPIYFLGRFYSPTRPLPWWNGFFWLATTVPTALLAFAALGGGATLFGKIGKNKAVEPIREDVKLGKNGEIGEKASAPENEENGKPAVALAASTARLIALENKIGELGGELDGVDKVDAADELDKLGKLSGFDKLDDVDNVDAAGELGKLGGVDKVDAASGGGDGRPLAALALAFAATLPLVRILPGIPTHDGARLLIASFPFVAILAAFGATFFVDWRERTAAATEGRSFRRAEAMLRAALADLDELERDSCPKAANECRERVWGNWAEWRKREEPRRRKRKVKTARRLAQLVVASAFAVGLVDLVRSAPQYLSFYNATLGGVVGATRRGMEATYYWDAFDADAVAWLNAEIAAARSEDRPSGVLFGSFSSQTLDYYRRWGTLATSEIATLSSSSAFAKRDRFGFYVVQRRPSGWTALELALFQTARPLYRKTTGNPLDCGRRNAERREVVLLEIYDFRDVERVLTAMERAQAPQGEKQTSR